VAANGANVADGDVFALTELGDAHLKGAHTSLSEAQLKVLVLIDGKSTAVQLMNGMPVLAPIAVRDNLRTLLTAGLIRLAKETDGAGIAYIDPGDFFKTIGKPVRLPSLTETVQAEASSQLSTLQQSGYSVRIARRSATYQTKPEGALRVVLVVDDDPDIGKLLTTVFRMEGYAAVVASNKAEVLDALRRTVPPDIALLDVNLPDVDGFHILSRMRQHPVLKAVPAIMLTASATRGDVLKGLHFGADGYITKPFRTEVLMKAVRTVLGIGA